MDFIDILKELRAKHEKERVIQEAMIKAYDNMIAEYIKKHNPN